MKVASNLLGILGGVAAVLAGLMTVSIAVGLADDNDRFTQEYLLRGGFVIAAGCIGIIAGILASPKPLASFFAFLMASLTSLAAVWPQPFILPFFKGVVEHIVRLPAGGFTDGILALLFPVLFGIGAVISLLRRQEQSI